MADSLEWLCLPATCFPLGQPFVQKHASFFRWRQYPAACYALLLRVELSLHQSKQNFSQVSCCPSIDPSSYCYFLILSDPFGNLIATCEVYLNPPIQDTNTRGGILRRPIVRMSKARKYVRIKSRVNGRAKRTNTCPLPCKRNLSAQKTCTAKNLSGTV